MACIIRCGHPIPEGEKGLITYHVIDRCYIILFETRRVNIVIIIT